MPYRKEQFITGQVYHIIIKAIDDNMLFKNIDDYFRGIFSIYEFNNLNSVNIRERRRIRAKLKSAEANPLQTCRGLASAGCGIEFVDNRDKLIEVWAFCLMPNHIHLLVKQLNDGGITKFMSKFGTGFGGYFNRKYNRQGRVFQNTFVAVRIKNDRQLRTVFVYIHTNPISIIEPKWKEMGIKDPDRVIKFLEQEYRWSSYFDKGHGSRNKINLAESILAIFKRARSDAGLKKPVSDEPSTSFVPKLVLGEQRRSLPEFAPLN